MRNIETVYQAMIEYYRGDSHQIQHFAKVHTYSRLIGTLEGLDEETMITLEMAALVHDVGIKAGMEKYGRGNGKIQEELGPAIAEELLTGLGVDPDRVARISYLVGHHHTYTNVEGLDYRILLEADFLVNLHEEKEPMEGIVKAYEEIFRTEAGKKIVKTMFNF
ncbi:MAG: phosphohydrolase [Firmicutes bacterium]|nr:phosphohydrolase [Bacillota bacterium]MBQ2270700.1 phosphohydrolase [Bacillota bacterium]MBQ6949284.1 phosphohydrolase [Bacillota bacterium]MBR2002202.1 phosphohydrolase [Bacillota bacterium]